MGKLVHGEYRSLTYNTWANMKARCSQKSRRDYQYYGGRGIYVCERWQSYSNFLEDMGQRPEGFTLDRRNPDGNYTPENCIWVPARAQQGNQRRTVRVTKSDGSTVSLHQAVNDGECPITYAGVQARLRRGMSVEDALKAPSRYSN